MSSGLAGADWLSLDGAGTAGDLGRHHRSLRDVDRSLIVRRRFLVVALAASWWIAFIDSTAVNVALPSIQRQFAMSSTADDWVVTSFLLTSAVVIAAGGRGADIFGRRRVFMLGMGLFLVASTLCGVALTGGMLIVARGLQGVGAALLAPAAIALVTTNIPLEQRGRALGWMAAIGSTVFAAGPLLGGIITNELGWRWIFYFNVPVAVLIMVAVAAVAVESHDERARHLDVRGFLALSAGLTGLVLGLSQGPEWGFESPVTLVLLGVSGLLLVAFGVIESRTRDPLISLRLLRRPRVLAAGAVGFASNFVVLAVFVFGLLYCEKGLGFSPLTAALIFLAVTVPQLVTSPLSGQLADRVGPAAPVIGGIAIMAFAVFWLSAIADHAGVAALTPVLATFGVGTALVTTPARLMAQAAAPRRYQGMIAGVTSTLNRLGSILGVVIVGSILVALQYGNANDQLSRVGLHLQGNDHAALDSVLVQGTTGRKQLHEVPSTLIGVIRHAAHEGLTYAFSNSMRLIAVVAALAGVAALLLFRAKAPPEPPGDAAPAPVDRDPADPPSVPGSWLPSLDRLEVTDHRSGRYHLQW
ncbi:MAG TPA: MFS transporter [Acidimicrobiales bacterium]